MAASPFRLLCRTALRRSSPRRRGGIKRQSAFLSMQGRAWLRRIRHVGWPRVAFFSLAWLHVRTYGPCRLARLHCTGRQCTATPPSSPSSSPPLGSTHKPRISCEGAEGCSRVCFPRRQPLPPQFYRVGSPRLAKRSLMQSERSSWLTREWKSRHIHALQASYAAPLITGSGNLNNIVLL